MKVANTRKANKPPCRWCGKPLRPLYVYRNPEGRVTQSSRTLHASTGHWIPHRVDHVAGYGYKGNNYFCTTGCGLRYALDHASRSTT